MSFRRPNDGLKGPGTSPLLKAMVGSPVLRAALDSQNRVVESPALKSMAEGQRRLSRSPLLKAMVDSQNRVVESPALKSMAEGQRRLSRSPLLKAMVDSQKRAAESPALKAMVEGRRRLSTSPLLKAMVGSPVLKAALDSQTRVVEILGASRTGLSRRLQGQLRRYTLESLDRVALRVDREWAALHTENADYPAPVLFLISSFTRAVGEPLYQAVKLRDDDSALLAALEPVLTEPAFVREVQSAIQRAPYLHEVSKRHLITGFTWMARRQYVDAYPPIYNGLEPAFVAVARDIGLVDEKNVFLTKSGKAKKVEDLFADLPLDPVFRRFLRAWVFGDRGNPFRHGDISDPEECRRQALRLAAAVIGWLEVFGGWTASGFRERLELEVAGRQAQRR